MEIDKIQKGIEDMWKRTKSPASDFDFLLFFMEEVGEMAEAIRKNTRGKDNDRKIDLNKEIGDVFFMLISIANKYNIDCSVAIKVAMDDIERRYCNPKDSN